MEQTVYKYPVPAGGGEVETHQIIRWLHAEMIDGEVYAWALVYDDLRNPGTVQPTYCSWIGWFLTGESVERGSRHLSTFTDVDDGKTYVGHVFTRGGSR